MTKKSETFNINTLEKTAFWVFVPIAAFSCIVGLLTHNSSEYYSTSISTLILFIVIVLIMIVIMAVCYFTKAYHICYPLACILISAIALPILFLNNGAFYSGMPSFMLATALSCCFCSKTRMRMITFTLTLVGDVVAFVLAKNGYALQNNYTEEYFTYDVIVDYFVSVISSFCACAAFMHRAKRFESGAKVLENYVDENVAEGLISKAESNDDKITGELKRVTVMFADIDNFTSTSEKLDPISVAEYVNVFLEICDEAIAANGGVLDKYIGDCAMAYWIDEKGNGDGIENALKAAIQIREKVLESNPYVFNRYDADLNFAGGICYGDVVIGDMGSSRRRQYTVMGDTVNTASRIQGVAHKNCIIVTENIAEMMKNKVSFRKIKRRIEVKGKKEALTLYELKDFMD